MKFDWDPNKSALNRIKHGVSFEDAVSLWDLPHVEVMNVARVRHGEMRNATMGLVRGRVYLAIWTLRDQTIRLISVRKANSYEEKIFHESIQDS